MELNGFLGGGCEPLLLKYFWKKAENTTGCSVSLASKAGEGREGRMH